MVTGPALASGLSGVSVASGDLFVVGLGGVKWRQDAKGAWSDDTDHAPTSALHGTWAAPDGSAQVPCRSEVGAWSVSSLHAPFASCRHFTPPRPTTNRSPDATLTPDSPDASAGPV